MKRIFAAFISAAIIMISFSGCSRAAGEERVTPPFFCVRDESTGGCVYMLGSMHVGKPNTVYPEEINRAFEESELLACEVDTVALSSDRELITQCSALLLCPEGTQTADYLGEDYESIAEFFRANGIMNNNLNSYLPVMWESMLSNSTAKKCGFDSEYGTEQTFLSLAKQTGKPIVEIESALAQYEMTSSEPTELSRYSLKTSVLGGTEKLNSDMLRLYNAWAQGDGECMAAMLNEEMPPEELSEEYAAYYNAMYTDRQKVMADSVVAWLSEGKTVFMMVGALHYYAEPDILTVLQQAGYQFESAYAPTETAPAA